MGLSSPLRAAAAMFQRKPSPEVATPKGELADDDLDQKLRDALKKVVEELEQQTDQAYRIAVKNAAKRRHFWPGRQFLVWNPQEGTWLPREDRPDVAYAKPQKVEDTNRPRETVINHWQAKGLTNVSVLSENEPTLKWSARDDQSGEDERRSRAFQKFHGYYTTTNGGARILQSERALKLWTDGVYIVRLRYKTDGLRFGYREVPVLGMAQEPQELSPAVYRCSACGLETPPEENPGVCPGCLKELGPESYVAGETDRPIVTNGVKRYPKGTVRADVLGVLECRWPLTGRTIREWNWFMVAQEVEKAEMRSRFQKLAHLIGAKGEAGDVASFARVARMELLTENSSSTNTDFVTEKQVYLRPTQFWHIDDAAVRADLFKRFPDGCKITFADDRYLKTEAASMDDEFVSCFGLPCDGSRPLAIGQSAVAVQESLNDSYNMELEACEHGLPMYVLDEAIVDEEAFEGGRAIPGAALIAAIPAGKNARDMIGQTDAIGVSPNAIRLRQDLAGPIMDELSGAPAALWGGDASGAGDTFRGYAAQQKTAKGKLMMPWQKIQAAYEEEGRIAVRLFRKHHIADEIELSGGEKLLVSDLMGDFDVVAEIQEDFPVSWAEKRAVFMQIASGQAMPPEIASRFMTPENDDTMLKYIGLTDLVVAGEKAREKQSKELESLLLGVWVDVDPMDDDAAEANFLVDWHQSEEGMLAKSQNPMGYQMALQHWSRHMQAAMMKAAMFAGPTAAPGAPPGEGPPPIDTQQPPSDPLPAGGTA